MITQQRSAMTIVGFGPAFQTFDVWSDPDADLIVQSFNLSSECPAFMIINDPRGPLMTWAEPGALITNIDDESIESDIEAGLAALKEPMVATWDEVKGRLGL